LYGADFVKGSRYQFYFRLSLLFSRQFPCSTWIARFLAPTHTIGGPARAEAVKDGRALAPTEGSSLDGFEHDGTLERVGMTNSRGAACWCTNIRATSLYAAGPKTQTMMQ
jgi:hypothetical protein